MIENTRLPQDKINKLRDLVVVKNLKYGAVALKMGWTRSQTVYYCNRLNLHNDRLNPKATKKELDKLRHLVSVKKMKHNKVAELMGKNWSQRRVVYFCQRYCITNNLHGGQFAIPKEEVEFQKKLMAEGKTYQQIAVMINKKFHHHLTQSSIAHRARRHNLKVNRVLSREGVPLYTPEEDEIITTLYYNQAPPVAYVRALNGRSWDGIRHRLTALLANGKVRFNYNPKVATKLEVITQKLNQTLG